MQRNVLEVTLKLCCVCKSMFYNFIYLFRMSSKANNNALQFLSSAKILFGRKLKSSEQSVMHIL